MKYRLLLATLVMALLAGTSAYAHHSYAATYDVEQSVRLEGRLVQFALRNPHSYVHISAPDQNGDVQRWAVEWSAPGTLNRQGVSRDTLRSGDEIVLTVRPSRVRGEYRALMLTLERPKDGLSWGTNPDQVVD
jgi:hypothetical protein